MIAAMEEPLVAEAQKGIFDALAEMGHEQVVMCSDAELGLKAIIGVHSTVLGPALGGTRFWHYATEAEAIKDVLRLSRGMTFKNSIAGLKLGGGKAVIIGNPIKIKTPALMRRFGQFVESLGGRYITAEDVGVSTVDMESVFLSTKHVTGLPEHLGGGGDPSPHTAYGVFLAIKASANRVWGSDSLAGKRILVQGTGHVGSYLAERLVAAGAKVVVADLYEDRALALAARIGATVVPADEVIGQNVDIYAPCALGGILNSQNIPELKCAIVAGAANNQLDNELVHGPMLADRGILYAPDFLINSGGVMNVYQEMLGYDRALAVQRVETIYDTLLHIYDTAQQERITTHQAALDIALARINATKLAATLRSN